MSFRRRMMMGGGTKKDYLCFTALEDGEFTLTMPAPLNAGTFRFIEYTVDGKNWVKTDNVSDEVVTVTTPLVHAGERVLWRGEGYRTAQSAPNNARPQAARFSATCKYDVSGWLMSLLAGRKVKESSHLGDSAFACLFADDTNIVNARDLIVPENVAYRCYYSMFNKCTSLVSAPTLPALYLADADRCYESMFADCTNAGFNYMKMLAIDIGDTTGSRDYCTRLWMYGVKEAATSVFVKHIDAVWDVRNYAQGVPTKWKIIYYDPDLDKYYLDQNRETECDDHGNVINV